mgnify:FL=1
MKNTAFVIGWLFASALGGCGGEMMEPLPVSPLDGQSCAGFIDSAPSGANQVEDATLLQEALGKSGEGKLCVGRVLEALQSVAVYRVWNAAKDYTEFGRWWSLSKPMGPVERYRTDNEICPEWSDLNQLTVCSLKIGARFVMGPGQSAQCMMMSYDRSPINQVYVPNDTRASKVYVENCMRLGAWPN